MAETTWAHSITDPMERLIAAAQAAIPLVVGEEEATELEDAIAALTRP